jgi:SAM-dependent methyltransferase
MKRKLFKNRIDMIRPSVLDLGCFDGRKNAWMLQYGCKYKGVDLLVENEHVEKGDFVEFLRKDKGKYDLVLLEFSLQQIKIDEALEIMPRIGKRLKKGGYIYIQTFIEKKYFTQRELCRIADDFSIRYWNQYKSKDKRGRDRDCVEILLKKL